jgi:protein SCO1/2
MRAQLGRVAEALGDDVLLVSHSITPEQDSVERLADYARAQGITEGGWHLLTGDPTRIRDLAAASYFVELDDETGNTRGDLMHTETMVLVDEEGRIRGVYNGTMAYDVNQLIADARTLIEA